MLAQRVGFGFLICLVALLAVQSATAEVIDFEPETNGQILISSGGIDDLTVSTIAAPAGPSSNPVTYVPGIVGANWVFQFKLSDLPDVLDILDVQFSVDVEGNTDPELKFGLGHGGVSSAIGVGEYMSPGKVMTYSVSELVGFFSLDVTSAIMDAIDDGYEYYRFALTANPEATSFASASVFDPNLQVEVVPEPATFALFGFGTLLLGAWRFRRRR